LHRRKNYNLCAKAISRYFVPTVPHRKRPDVKTILLATAAFLLVSQAHAQDAEMSLETRRMLAYGTLAVMTGACKTPLTPAQSSQIKTGLETASKAQTELSEGDFTEMMKAAGAQVGANKAEVCAALTPEFISNGIADAAAGK